jgi:hypothetical protein
MVNEQEKTLDQLESITEKHRDLNAYLSIAIEAYNLGVQKSIENCIENDSWDRESLESLKIAE